MTAPPSVSRSTSRYLPVESNSSLEKPTRTAVGSVVLSTPTPACPLTTDSVIDRCHPSSRRGVRTSLA
ncbi:Uncharacterised protein [Mycobacteroides abscessus subsp. abscessus]|nr:Uncharacterised protein [Mycobacteroides abscessus subsp. abscessus]